MFVVSVSQTARQVMDIGPAGAANGPWHVPHEVCGPSVGRLSGSHQQ